MSILRNWAEIDLRALRHNLGLISRTGREVMVMVKADAYGHGAVPVSRAARRGGAKQLAVAFPAEAAELRSAGIKAPINLVTSILPPEIREIIKYDLIVPVCRFQDLNILSAAARRYRKCIKINLKIDTGLGRLGVSVGQLPVLGARLRLELAAKRLKLEGIYSHLAVADTERGFTREQVKRLWETVDYLERVGVKSRFVHVENSAALLYYDLPGFNLARPGLMLYGLDPAPGFRLRSGLRPVISLHSRVLQVRQLNPGDSVSYGRHFTAKKKMKVAVVSIGYADGYPRALSGKASVIIRGRKRRQLGTVCMDMIVVDASKSPQISIGDPVVLIGRKGKEGITAQDLADQAGTISYEITCGISKRVVRVYKR